MDLRYDRIIRFRLFRRDVVSMISREDKGIYLIYTGNPLSLKEDNGEGNLGKLSELSLMELKSNERKINEGQVDQLIKARNSAYLSFEDIKSVNAKSGTWLSRIHFAKGPIMIIHTKQGTYHLKFRHRDERYVHKVAKYLNASSQTKRARK